MSASDRIYDILIIGGGPAGLAAAIYCSRSKLKTIIIVKNPLAGALYLASRIENYPGVPEPVSGRELHDRLLSQAKAFGAQLVRDEAVGVDFRAEPKEIMGLRSTHLARAVIIATGAMGRKPSVKGEAEFAGKGVSYCAECDAPLFQQKDVVVAGRAELFLDDLPEIQRFARLVYLVPEGGSAERVAGIQDAQSNLEVMSGWHLGEITGDAFVTGVRLSDKAGNDRQVLVSGVFLYMQGRLPIVQFLGSTLDLDRDQCVTTRRGDMGTSIDGVYAAGDITCRRVRQVVFAVADGCLAAVSAISYLNRS